MSKQLRNTIQKRALAKREPLAIREARWMPPGPPAAATAEARLREKHYERRRRNLESDRYEAA